MVVRELCLLSRDAKFEFHDKAVVERVDDKYISLLSHFSTYVKQKISNILSLVFLCNLS